MRKLFTIAWGAILIAALVSCTSEPEIELVPGGIYSVESGEGSYGIAKLLVLEDGIAHVRIYKNRFDERPSTIELDTLTLGSIHDTDGFGIGHLPIKASEFRSWRPELLIRAGVTTEELEGYSMWKEAGGGVFGP